MTNTKSTSTEISFDAPVAKGKAPWQATPEQVKAAKNIVLEQAALDKTIGKMEGDFQKKAIAFLALFDTEKHARATYIAALPRDMTLETASKRWSRYKSLAMTGTTQSQADIDAKARAKEKAEAAKLALASEDEKPNHIKKVEKVAAIVGEALGPDMKIPSPAKLELAIVAHGVSEYATPLMDYTKAIRTANKHVASALSNLRAMNAPIDPQSAMFSKACAWATFADGLTKNKTPEEEKAFFARDLGVEITQLNLMFSK
jgi:hypothetical protein